MASDPPHPQVKCSIIKNEPLFDVPDVPNAEPPRAPPPRNDVTNRFWSMVDTYCQEMTADDIKVRLGQVVVLNTAGDIKVRSPCVRYDI